ncbi:hypothetical protein [Enterococcus phage vB_EfaS-SRH2]|nr:hypothetical protein [Enterococcus phage vB_EfaS-SRH2]
MLVNRCEGLFTRKRSYLLNQVSKTLLSVVRQSVCGRSANHITTLNHLITVAVRPIDLD